MGITPATPVHEPPEVAAVFDDVFLCNTVTGVSTAPTPHINIGRGDVTAITLRPFFHHFMNKQEHKSHVPPFYCQKAIGLQI
jgi:hypothetical protein